MKKGECRSGCDGRHPDHGTKKIHCLGCVVCRSLGLNLSTKSAQSKQRLAIIKVKKGLPVTAEEAALAAEQIELDRLEAERAAAAKRAADVQRLMELQLSPSDAEALLDAHDGDVEAAVSARKQQQQREEEQRRSEAARDAAVELLRAMGFENSLEELHSILSSKNNNMEQAVDALLEKQRENLEKQSKCDALVGLGWNDAAAQDALEQHAWDKDAAEVALKQEKHKVQCRNHRRIKKVLRKQHIACLAGKDAPCNCKGAELAEESSRFGIQILGALVDMRNKRDALVGLGWNDAAAQDALERHAWDKDAAEVALKQEKHLALCQNLEQDGRQKRLEKIFKKQHSACEAEKGVACNCKGAEACRPAAPVHPKDVQCDLSDLLADLLDVHAQAEEEFSGAFAVAKRPEPLGKDLFPVAEDNMPPSREVADDDEGFIVVRAQKGGRRRFWPCVDEDQVLAFESNESALNS
jgi:hypothetical protein